MNLAVAIDDEEDAMRDRKCIVSGKVLSEDKLIRFAISPDGDVTPDIAAILPGRGIWVSATRKALNTAIKKMLFAKAAKAGVKVAPDLADRVEGLLVARMQADLGMARRSGAIHLGFETVQRAIQSEHPPALIVQASDGAADGKRKLFGASYALGLKIETVECLTAGELSLAVGRENVIHAALKSGRLQERLSFDAGRLRGFRSVPEHERE